MKRTEEWDWPREPTRRRRRTVDADRTVSGMPKARPDFKFTRLGDFKHPRCYQPNSGWNSPVAKKIIDIYWQTMVFIVKVLISIPLTIMLVGSAWLIWVLLTL